MTETILITGASGFLGKRITRFLQRTSDAYLLTTSRQQESFPNHLVRDLSNITSELTKNVDTVIHFAGLAAHHSANEQDFIQSNVVNTENLVNVAIESGVKRFIFISTTDVYGTNTDDTLMIEEGSPLLPRTPFAQSKLEAENALKKLCEQSSMSFVILRLPLIYHIDAVNHFGQYISMIKSGRPLPLANIKNQRTLLALCNFESALNAVLHQPDLHNETLIIADSIMISTTEMIDGIAVAATTPVKLFYVPKLLAKVSLSMTGKGGMFDELWSDYRISSAYAQEKLNWQPATNYVVNLSK